MSTKARILNVTPNSPEWLIERACRLGASEAAACLGWSRYASPRELAERKRAAIAGTPFPDTPESEQQHRGHVLEYPVVRLYERATGRHTTTSAMMVHPEHDWMSATIDRGIVDGGALEVKTHNVHMAHLYGETGTDQIPDNEFVQVQHQMAVTGDPWTDLAVLLAPEEALDILTRMLDCGADLEQVVNLAANLDFRVLRIVRDEAFIADLVAAEQEFWDRYVLGDELPDDIKRMKPRDTVRPASATEEILLAEYIATYEANKTSEARLKELRPKVEDAIAGDSGLECPAGKITWKATAASEKSTTNWEGMALQLIQGMGLKQDAIDALMRDHTETVQSGGGRRFCVYPAGKKAARKSKAS